MQEEIIKLVTIITESSLESTLVRELEKCGAKGYTTTNARGKGSRGVREADWEANSNIRIEILCNEGIAEEIHQMLQKKYYSHFAMISFSHEVDVLRPNKF